MKYLADTIGVMYLGKLVEIGPSDELYTHAAHPYTQGLIDTIPVPDPGAGKPQAAAVKGELPSAISPPSGCRFRTRCPFAQDRCAEEEPLLRPFAKGHQAACHFPLQTPLSEDLPASAPPRREVRPAPEVRPAAVCQRCPWGFAGGPLLGAVRGSRRDFLPFFASDFAQNQISRAQKAARTTGVTFGAWCRWAWGLWTSRAEAGFLGANRRFGRH